MKKYIYIVITSAIVLFVSGVAVSNHVRTRIREVFEMNQIVKNEGYYVSEFEFKMLGVAYWLDHGRYIKSFATINNIHRQMKTREGLIKVPNFSGNKDRLEFYRNLQNQETGAFMCDSSYPLFSNIGVTANMLNFIEELSREAGEPFRLNCSLKFLDQIGTVEKLSAFLDDLSTVGWLGAKFRTPFVEIGELIELADDAERTGLYSFSPEWKQAFLQWCYNNQDATTGFWGARSRTEGALLDDGDLLATEKIIKLFVDVNGNEIHPEFPLKHRIEMFKTALGKFSEPMPEDLDELHDWILAREHGIRFLTRYLWKKASSENKEKAKKLMMDFLKVRFEKYYIEQEGAFSLYPGAEHADLDGTGEAIGMFDNIGSFSSEKQVSLWGVPEDSIIDAGIRQVSEITKNDFDSISNSPTINSVRVYKNSPLINYTSNVEVIYYPRETKVLDIVDLLPKLKMWIETTPIEMGNWVSKGSAWQNRGFDIFSNIRPAPVVEEDVLLKKSTEILKENSELVVIGFDVLQIPRYKIVFQLK